MPRQLARLLVLPLGLAALPTGLVLAQEAEPNPNVPVQNRPRPDFDPLGIRAGAFLIHPSVTLEGRYDDNVYASNDDEKGDVIGVVAPRISANSTWSRHALGVELGSEMAFYSDYTGNNYQDVWLDLDGRYDISSSDTLVSGLRLAREHENRDSPDDADEEQTNKVTKYYAADLRPRYRHRFNRVFTELRGDFRRRDYENVGDVTNNDRDRWQYGGGLRVGYDLSSRFDLFVQGDYRWVEYDNKEDDGGVERNNQGYDVRAGTEVDITGIIFGELSLGYTSVSYEDSELDDANGLSGEGSITWNITPLTTMIFTGTAGVDETTVSDGGEEASGKLRYTANAEVTHELLRNLLIQGNVGYLRDDFQGISRTDNSYFLGGGLTYLLNRNLSLEGTYSYANRNSDDDQAEYSRNIFRIGITARM